MNIQIDLNETKPVTIGLYDKVTNTKVTDAVVTINAKSTTDPNIVDSTFSGSLLNLNGKNAAGTATISISATCAYTNSIGMQVTETKNMAVVVTVGTPNETELRIVE